MQKDFVLSSDDHIPIPLIGPRDPDGVVSTEDIWRTVFRNHKKLPAIVHNEARRKLNLTEQISREYTKGKFRNTINPITGVPYSPLEHFSGVSSITANAGYKYDVVINAYLHDILEMNGMDNDLNMMLNQIFGPRNLGIILAVTDLGKLVDDIVQKDPLYFEAKTKYESKENFRIGMLMEFLEYIEAIPIKLADRIHNLPTLGSMPIESRKHTVLETKIFYKPIARCFNTVLFNALDELNAPYLIDPALKIYHADTADIFAALAVMGHHAKKREKDDLVKQIEEITAVGDERFKWDVKLMSELHFNASKYNSVLFEKPNPPEFEDLPESVKMKYHRIQNNERDPLKDLILKDEGLLENHMRMCKIWQNNPEAHKQSVIMSAWTDIISDLLFMDYTNRSRRKFIDWYFRSGSESKDLSTTDIGKPVIKRLEESGFEDGYLGGYYTQTGELVNHVIARTDRSYHEFVDDLVKPLDIWRYIIPRPMIALEMNYATQNEEVKGLRLIYDFMANAPLVAKELRKRPEMMIYHALTCKIKSFETDNPYTVVDIIGAKR